MSDYILTFADLQRAVIHSLGANPDANLTVTEIVNDALQELANMHPWRWRQRPLSLDSVMNQNYIVLPSNFGELLVVKLAGSAINGLTCVSLDQIIQMRQTGAASGTTFYALSFHDPLALTSLPLPVLELYPTPSSSTSGFIVGIYRPRMPKLVNDTDVPPIPPAWHTALKYKARALAVMQEEQQEGADAAMFERYIGPLIVSDGESPGYAGRAVGGLRPSVSPSLAGQTRQINGP